MTDDNPVPFGLLQRLAAGRLLEDELDLLEAYMQTEGLTSPPAHVLHRAQRIPRQLSPAVPAERPSLLRRIQAVLAGDSGARPVLAGTRGSAATRYLTFRAEETEVELELSPTSIGGQSLVGQVTSETRWSTVSVETVRGERLDTAVDEAGMFAFSSAGRPRTLQIRGETAIIVVDLPDGEGRER
jgi:hypothetical protein